MMFGRERHFYGIPSCRHCRALPRPPPPAPTTVRVARRPDSLPCCCVPLSSLHFLRSLFTHRRLSRSKTEPYRALGLGYRSKAQPTSGLCTEGDQFGEISPYNVISPNMPSCLFPCLSSERARLVLILAHPFRFAVSPSLSLPLCRSLFPPLSQFLAMVSVAQLSHSCGHQ